jgi:hypothetical protein
MNPIRVYADTSVFGGPFDAEFASPSKMFFDQVRMGRFQLVTSPMVEDEIELAPSPVRDHFLEVRSISEIAAITPAASSLSLAYLSAGVAGPASESDAIHVAIATVAVCTLIGSWNFRHIVHFDKIARYNAVNTIQGYGSLAIHSPAEVVSYEKRL